MDEKSVLNAAHLMQPAAALVAELVGRPTVARIAAVRSARLLPVTVKRETARVRRRPADGLKTVPTTERRSLNPWFILGLSAIAWACWVPRCTGEEGPVLEVGAAEEREQGSARRRVGPAIGMEYTVLEHYLEIEGGMAMLRRASQTDWEFDLLFKKPYRLSPAVEFMLGLGPTFSHTNAPAERVNTFGLEFAADFMFWTRENLGWYIEPTYGTGFSHEHKRSIGASAGLLIRFN